MKPISALSLMVFVVLTSCQDRETTREPIYSEGFKQKLALKKAPVTPATPVGTPQPTTKPIVESILRCQTMNVLFGGRDRADTVKEIKVSESDEGRSETLSVNSENAVYLESHKGIVRLRVEARNGYTRGQAEYSIDTALLSLSPDNQRDATGFVDVKCVKKTPIEEIVKPNASPKPGTAPVVAASPEPTVKTEKLKWTCSAQGFKNEQGQEITYEKSLEIEGEKAKSETLLDVPTLKLTMFSEPPSLGVRYGMRVDEKSPFRAESSAMVDSKATSFTLFQPIEGKPNLYKIECKRPVEQKPKN